MIDEIKKSVSATLYERLTSPLIGSYITSWGIWNYRVFLIFFSNMDFNQKTIELNNHFAGWLFLINGFALPVFGSFFYIFIYPQMAKFVFKRWQVYISDKEKIRQDIKEEVPITESQANELRQDIARQSVEFESRLTDKNERIKSLEERDNKNLARIDEKDKNIINLKNELEEKTTQLSVLLDRDHLIEKYGIKPDDGLMRAEKEEYKGIILCTKCLNDSPPKLIPLPSEIHHMRSQIHIKCPSCKGEYFNPYYDSTYDQRENMLIHRIDNDFLCWTNGPKKYCPKCATEKKDLKLAELAKVSETEYKCVLCDKSYNK